MVNGGALMALKCLKCNKKIDLNETIKSVVMKEFKNNGDIIILRTHCGHCLKSLRIAVTLSMEVL